MMKLIFVLAIVGLSLPTLAQSRVTRLDGTSISSQQVDDTVNRLIAAAHVTGAGIALFHDGNIAYLKAYGFRDTGKSSAAHARFRHDLRIAQQGRLRFRRHADGASWHP